jgi:hypothetical protein
LFQSIVDPKSQPGAYPISMFTYLMFDAGKLDCSKLYDVMFLVYWGWTDPRAAAIARAHSLSGLSAAVRGALVVGLRNISCNGSNLLEEVAYDYEPSIVGTGAAIPYVHASLSPIIDTKARFIWPCACHLAASRSTAHTNTHRVSSRSSSLVVTLRNIGGSSSMKDGWSVLPSTPSLPALLGCSPTRQRTRPRVSTV